VAIVAAAAGFGVGLALGSRDDEAVPVSMRCPSQRPWLPEQEMLLDAREVIGLSLREAEAVARRRDCFVRVVERDGKRPSVFLDHRAFRINVIVEHGRVKGVSDVG
jgi:hypothetical protein